jgi:hypothetical protein
VDTGTNVNNRDINILQSKAEHIEYLSSAISRYHTASGFPSGLRYYAGHIVAATGHKNNIPFHTSIRNTKPGYVSSIVAKIAPAIAEN